MKGFLLILISIALIWVSCAKEKNPPAPIPQPQPQLKVDSTSLSLNGTKNAFDSFTVQFSGNWSIAINPSTANWIKTSIASGSGNKKVYVTAEQDNTSGTAKTATIIVTPIGDATKAVNIAVTQKVFIPLSSAMWSKTFGGADVDRLSSIVKTSDGGYIAVGTTASSDGDVSKNKGATDVWVIKIDANGNKVWEKSYGGSSADYGKGIFGSNDGNFFITAETHSNDGDVTNNKGSFDLWVLKIDPSGNLLWQKTLGGTSAEHFTLHNFSGTSDGGCVVAGSAESSDGDVTDNKGNEDAWVVKLNSNGTVAWQKTFGGTKRDYAYAVTFTFDGGYLMAGGTFSNDGDVVGNHDASGNTSDAWIVKMDRNGNKLWQKALGGTGFDNANAIIPNTDGTFMVVCSTNSTGGDISVATHGGILNDAWVVKCSMNGSILWQKIFGGTKNDELFSVIQVQGGYVFSGTTESSDGDVSSNNGGGDAWVLKLNLEGQLLWQKTFGGTGSDVGVAVIRTDDNNVIISGSTESNDRDIISGNRGKADGWVVKVKNE